MNYRVYIQCEVELEYMKCISKCPKKGCKHDYYWYVSSYDSASTCE